MAEIVFGFAAILIAALLLIREAEHEEELEAAFNEGYKKGLYTNVVRVSSEEA